MIWGSPEVTPGGRALKFYSSVRIDLPPFTLIGATTRSGLITSPLRERFGIPMRVSFYSDQELEQIVVRGAGLLNMNLTVDGAQEIARRSRGTPRVAGRLLRRVRDFADLDGGGKIDAKAADRALNRLEVDELGLDGVHHKVLLSIIEKFDGGPVGLDTLAASISEEADTIMDVYEPYLLQIGFLDRTRTGRVATRRAYEHMGVQYPEQDASTAQPSLF